MPRNLSLVLTPFRLVIGSNCLLLHYMSSLRCPQIMTERPSLPGIHDLFGEHLALPIRRSSPFALSALSSTLPTKLSQTHYEYHETHSASQRRSERRQESLKSHRIPHHMGNKEHLSPYIESSRSSHTQRHTSSQHYMSREQDNYSSPSSTGSGDERVESGIALVPERKKLPAKYECEYCGKFFNRPSSLKIHHNTHTGQKPFACVFPGCGRSFSVMSNMRRHARTHGDSAVLLAREHSDSELTSIQLTPVPGFLPTPSTPNSRGSSRSTTPLSYQRMPSRVPPSRSSSVSSDSSL